MKLNKKNDSMQLFSLTYVITFFYHLTKTEYMCTNYSSSLVLNVN